MRDCRLLPRLAAPVLSAATRALGQTLRLRVDGLDEVRPFWRDGRPVVYAVWHGQALMIPWLNAHLRRRAGARAPRVLVSRSADGELAARVVQRFGLPVARGSSSRGGAGALRALASALAAGEDVAVVPDGPRGPREVAQPGVVALAALSGAPIVPVAFAARPARRLRSWDAMLVPAPFARAAAVFGSPVAVARDGDREAARGALEHALAEASAAATRLVAA